MLAWIRSAGWLVACLVVLVTLEPLRERPRLTYDVQLERFLAFAILGYLLALGHPKRRRLLLVVLILGSGLLEIGQHFTPDRHPGWRDWISKACGALVGVGLVVAAQRASRIDEHRRAPHGRPKGAGS